MHNFITSISLLQDTKTGRIMFLSHRKRSWTRTSTARIRRKKRTTTLFLGAMTVYLIFIFRSYKRASDGQPSPEPSSSYQNDQARTESRRKAPELNNEADHQVLRPDVIQLLTEPLPKSAKIHKLSININHDDQGGDSLVSCQHVFVTGYFSIRSKYAPDQYLKWMANFLSVQDCMVIFTSSEMMDPIRKYRSAALNKTVLIELSIEDLPISKLGIDLWEHQLDIDREKKRHKSYQLFWIWLSKSWCVVQAIRHDFFGSRREGQRGLFMWQDIGSFRNTKYNGKTILVHHEIVPPRTVLWLAHHPTNPPPNPMWNDKFKEKQYYFHSGSQGVGDADAWLDYHDKFAKTIQQFLDKGMFIGEDQCVLQSTCQQYPELCAYIPHSQVKDNFYFGLRYVLVNGGNYKLWRMPKL